MEKVINYLSLSESEKVVHFYERRETFFEKKISGQLRWKPMPFLWSNGTNMQIHSLELLSRKIYLFWRSAHRPFLYYSRELV